MSNEEIEAAIADADVGGTTAAENADLDRDHQRHEHAAEYEEHGFHSRDGRVASRGVRVNCRIRARRIFLPRTAPVRTGH